jgi:methylenetetrahydrofolate dehydrogenase (NADP+)/methenyltetrahydrofolate cyclohydrolase
MTLWKGAPVAAALTEALIPCVEELKNKGVTPCLAVVRVGQREDDLSYERGLTKRFTSAGAAVEPTALAEDVTQEELEACICTLNERKDIHGILMFSPLPRHLDEQKVRAILSPAKDVDCMTDANAYCVYAGRTSEGVPGYPPCTPQAVLEMLDFYGYDLTGKNVTVVGRSAVVGKPLSMLMLQRNATVTVCHTRTKDLPAVCKQADLLVVAAGKAGLVTNDHVRPGQAVVDVGIHVVDGKLCGDAEASVGEIAECFTPVPGGVGAVTTSVLLKHTVDAAEKSV